MIKPKGTQIGYNNKTVSYKLKKTERYKGKQATTAYVSGVKKNWVSIM